MKARSSPLLFALLLLVSGAGHPVPICAAPPPGPEDSRSLDRNSEVPGRSSATLLGAASWWAKVWKSITKFMGTQTGMVQIAAVFMILSLFIIWYRRN